MMSKVLSIVVAAMAMLVVSLTSNSLSLRAQSTSAGAVSGTVTSQDEGTMEGVVVSARRQGANFTVSVVSDARGRYSFPRTHLEPGSYDVTIRAVGYNLSAPARVTVGSDEPAMLELLLEKTKNLLAQLTSLEVATSLPGPQDQVHKLVYQRLSCAYCHTYNRIVTSRHSAERWVTVIDRMASYYPDGTASSDDGRGSWRVWENDFLVQDPKWGLGIGVRQEYRPGIDKTELAEYLATINLSGDRTELPYELETLPRPTGKATRVIITQYDLPRNGAVSHEMELDSKGTPWYTDESEPFLGTLDPRTGRFTEYPITSVNGQQVLSARDIVFDPDDNPWFPLRTAAGDVLVKFDVKTSQIVPVPDFRSSQFLAAGDGNIWTAQGSGFARINPKTMSVEARFDWTTAPNKPEDACCSYQGVVDANGNAYMGANNYVVAVDGTTGVMQFIPIPTKWSLPRRGRMDSQGRYWFAQYFGDRIGMFDSRTKTVQEWPVRTYSTPYTASVPDRNGYVYAASNMSERVIQLDPTTGEVIEYLMPTQFDSKKIAVHPAMDRTEIWMANTRNARLIKLEPLD